MTTTKKEEVVIPLLFYVQRIQRLIYEIPSDEEAMALVTENFSPNTVFEWNSETIDLDEFKKFVQGWRSGYTLLDLEFHEAVTTPDTNDEKGRGGTIGFGMKGRVLGKDDGEIYEGKLQ
ncbi:hypothetical protein BO78DRAFT_409054 [Aspergillus sclerotiicarbonarius CBS 121057]|uniref:SnoaL-like domain-containing protein n=1 Tax=Aspergillus sclerotiicarbonarius (strain CBS 121057 / IBT 28362) TaxID=1448318 RepID=A0A319E8I4_ASPSB|nr:hypothetical protein BO78DRAFT_409054 [Aspergillus sclerotiicarbonarius CBS 121057]